MKIAFFTQLYMPDTGGAEILMDRLVRSLQAQGHLVVVIAPQRRGNQVRLSYPVVRTLRPFSKHFLQHTLPPLLYAYARYRFEIIHCQSEYYAACVAHTFKRLTGVPYVVRALGGQFNIVSQRPNLAPRMRRALQAADGAIAQGAFLYRQILDYGVEADRITTIHNGVDPAEILVDGASPRQLPYLLYLGGLRHVKGYDVLLRAFAEIVDDIKPVQLLMAGGNQENEQFIKLLHSLGLSEEQVVFVGNMDRRQTALHLRHALLYVCPFRRSPFSNANLEALMAGTPIVATAVDGNIEQIRDGQDGALVPVEDPKQLALAIKGICRDTELRRRMSMSATEHAQCFTWDKMVKKYLSLYQTVLQRSASNADVLTKG